ncbi:MAG: LmbE family N-acetylglucosaminyl deacetylase [Planctomycetota bacterium]|jgi:LmbE family N-acetylglucosaminyl deacetylase
MIEADNLLVIAPHPDDEVLGCGGTIALAAERGAKVHVLVVFDGAAGDPEGRFDVTEYVDRRRCEARAGGAHLGVSDYTFWNLPEGHLALEHEIEAGAWRLQQLIDRIQPDLVLAPWEGDDHPDHKTVSKSVQRMLALSSKSDSRERKRSRKYDVWGFEVWSPLDAEHLVDVSSVWGAKLSALREHRTQLEYADLLGRMTSLARRHNTGLLESFALLKSAA